MSTRLQRGFPPLYDCTSRLCLTRFSLFQLRRRDLFPRQRVLRLPIRRPSIERSHRHRRARAFFVVVQEGKRKGEGGRRGDVWDGFGCAFDGRCALGRVHGFEHEEGTGGESILLSSLEQLGRDPSLISSLPLCSHRVQTRMTHIQPMELLLPSSKLSKPTEKMLATFIDRRSLQLSAFSLFVSSRR